MAQTLHHEALFTGIGHENKCETEGFTIDSAQPVALWVMGQPVVDPTEN